MTHLTNSITHQGHWSLDERELTHDDVIEILILGKWYRARVSHDMGLREYRLLVDGITHSLPMAEDIPARWLGMDSRTKHKATGKEG